MSGASLYLFNPTCDYATGNGRPSWQPNKMLQKMEADMDALPLFFAALDDCVLVEKIPLPEFFEPLLKMGIRAPVFIEKKRAFHDEGFINQLRKSLQPWGWSPAVHKFLSPFKNSCSETFKQSPVFYWSPEQREIRSRKYALEILHRLIHEFPENHFISFDQTASVCTQKKDFEQALSKWKKIMVKSPWSSSGRGLQPISKTPVHPKVWEKLAGIVKTQGYAMAEPLLNRKADIAFQFKVEKQKVSFVGISNFTTDNKGQYMGNNLNGLPGDWNKKLLDFVRFVPQIIVEPLTHILESGKIAAFYEGYLGVDALIYEDKYGGFKINPCLEINLRYNMGLLSVLLEKHLATNRKGVFRTWFHPEKLFIDFKKEMEQMHPPSFSGNRLEKGFVALTSAQSNSHFGAFVFI